LFQNRLQEKHFEIYLWIKPEQELRTPKLSLGSKYFPTYIEYLDILQQDKKGWLFFPIIDKAIFKLCDQIIFAAETSLRIDANKFSFEIYIILVCGFLAYVFAISSNHIWIPSKGSNHNGP